MYKITYKFLSPALKKVIIRSSGLRRIACDIDHTIDADWLIVDKIGRKFYRCNKHKFVFYSDKP